MTKPLRIGFVSVQDATDLTQWSGIPAHMLRSLQKLDAEIELFSPLSRKARYLLAPAKALARLHGWNPSLDHSPLMLHSYARQIERAIRRRPVDVVFSTSSLPIAVLKCRQPVLFWTDAVFHAMVDYYDGQFSNMSTAAIERGQRAEEDALNNCTVAIYSSEWAAASARQIAAPDKIHVIPFGANLPIAHFRSDVERWANQRREQRPAACELLFIGVNWQRKGGSIAVEAARLLNEAGIATRLTVVGCDPEQPVPDYVRGLGFISKRTEQGQAQLKTLLSEADFLILPTQAEAAGIVFCEASAFGLPVLSYATGGVPEYVRDGINGLCFPPGTPAVMFADAIRGLLKDPLRYEALCLGGFDQYKYRLNWQTSAGELLALCHRAITSISYGVRRW